MHPLFMDVDPADHALRHLREADVQLGGLIDRVGRLGLRLGPASPDETDSGNSTSAWQTPFTALVRSVVYQQLSGRIAEIILGRVLALYPGKPFPDPGDLLDTPDEPLRAAGLSRNKLLAIRAIAEAARAGLIPPSTGAAGELDDETLIAQLTTIRGVGRWTVEMLLMFHLGRPDVLPATDYGVRKGYAVTYGLLPELPTPKALLAHGERWRPFRSVAAWYLWRALEQPPG